jgi:hypothetical protein
MTLVILSLRSYFQLRLQQCRLIQNPKSSLGPILALESALEETKHTTSLHSAGFGQLVALCRWWWVAQWREGHVGRNSLRNWTLDEYPSSFNGIC